MLKTLLPYVASFAVASIGMIGLRLTAGPERGQRLAGLFVGVAIIAALFAVPGFAWTAAGPLNRIGHIIIGAVLVGASLDLVKPRNLWRWVVLGLFVLGCGWASAVNTLIPKITPSLGQLGLALALAVIWLGIILRFTMPQAHKPTKLVVLIAAVAGIAVLASIAGDVALVTIALSIMAAVFAFVVCAIVLNIELNDSATLPIASSLVAMAWALSQRHPEALLGLGILTLVLFAERTARRVPMPQGGIAAYLYLCVLAGFCGIPILIAAVLVSAAVPA